MKHEKKINAHFSTFAKTLPVLKFSRKQGKKTTLIRISHPQNRATGSSRRFCFQLRKRRDYYIFYEIKYCIIFAKHAKTLSAKCQNAFTGRRCQPLNFLFYDGKKRCGSDHWTVQWLTIIQRLKRMYYFPLCNDNETAPPTYINIPVVL